MKKIFLFLLLVSPLLRAQTSKELLADGLFAEEANGDLRTATQAYEDILKIYENERKIAATALYRLAEIRGKEDQAGAVRLLKKLLAEFSDIHPQGRLATEKLKALGEDLPATGVGIASPELKAIEELNQLATTSPDRRVTEEEVRKAASQGWSRYLQYVFEAQGLAALKGGLHSAVSSGNLEITKLLIEAGIDPNSEGAFGVAVEKGFEAIIAYLVEKGADLTESNPSYVFRQLLEGQGSKVARLRRGIALGAKVDGEKNVKVEKDQLDWSRKYYSIPLLNAVRQEDQEVIDLLLENKADPNLVEFEGGVSALHLAVYQNSPEIVKALIKAGADPKYKTTTPENVRVPLPGSNGVPFGKVDPIPVLTSRVRNPEVIMQLLEAGAPVPEGALLSAAEAGSLELVKAYLEKGANIEEFLGEKDKTPLYLALREGHGEVAEFLRGKGAKVHFSHWKLLSGEKALQWNREINYPFWAKEDLVTFFLPEFPQHQTPGFGAVLGKLKPGPGIYQEMLELNYPGDISLGGGIEQMPNPDKLVWNLVRKGTITRLDFSADGFPDLEAGDIVEAVGVSKEASPLAVVSVSRKLGDYRESGLRHAILEKINVPFVLKLGEIEHALEIRGDCLAYDPRTKIVPYFETLDQLFTMTGIKWKVEGNIVRSIRIRHEEIPDFPVPAQADTRLRLHSGDLIEVTEVSQSAQSIEDESLDRRRNHVSVAVPGRLCGWNWFVNSPASRPTLLQVLAEINRGLEQKEGSDFLVSPDGPFSPVAIAPGIDLTKIKIQRLGEDWRQETLDIDLAAEIRKWESNERTERPYDLELAAGDIVELVLKEGEWAGDEEADSRDQYLQEALSMTIIDQTKGETIHLIKLTYEPPKWQKMNGFFWPVAGLGTVEWRRQLSSIFQNATVVRGGDQKYGIDQRFSTYFPREGDVITQGPVPPPPGAPRVNRTRTKYVPRPKQ